MTSLSISHGSRMLMAARCSRQLNLQAFRHHVRECGRRWKSGGPKEMQPPPTTKNIMLAGALVAFCGSVFTYSLRAVGRNDGTVENGADDPLAQLKAEAQEARDSQNDQKKGGRMSPEEIAALESGIRGNYREGEQIEIAVAAPDDIAQLEEEANMKVFQSSQQKESKKKKPWWRFGL